MTATRLTPALILRELAKMSLSEMEGMLGKLQVITAVKKGALKPSEAKMLQAINATLSPEDRANYRKLTTKRKKATLTPAEHRELIRLSDAVEMLHAHRVQGVIKLAALRKVTVPELLKQLGLPSLAAHDA